jgi:hypothetical protein
MATAEKWRLACGHALDQFVELVRWIKERPVASRRWHHAVERTFPLPFGF